MRDCIGRLLLCVFLLAPLFAFGQSTELQTQIDERKAAIEALEKEIVQYQRELEAVSREKQTFESAIRALDLSIKKVSADIRLTEKRITAKDQEIRELGVNIKDTRATIDGHRAAIAETLRGVSQAEDNGLTTTILAYGRLSSFFDELATRRQFQTAVEERVGELSAAKKNLEDKKTVSEKKRHELASLRTELIDQKKGLDVTKTEKNKLLASTKNRESNYQRLIGEKMEARAAFEAELGELEGKLHLSIDPSRLPKVGSGVLSWPIDSPYITQYFGNTTFATANPQIYSGKGHGGIDLRAAVGTPIKAALAGVVEGIGDTDLTCPYASYGRWVLIRHGNGLTTLYAHLSYIKVSKGQAIGTRETIGYAGNTGYATGPHLHFSVYATQGVEISSLASKSPACRGRIYTLPIADQKAYLNPLSYL